MKTIDLVAADAALYGVMAEFGVENCSRCVDIEYWNHGNGGRELNVRMTAFLDENSNCVSVRGTTWEDAIESLRIKLREEKKFDGEINVIVPEVGI